MSAQEKVNILMVDDQPGKLLSYEVILAELNENLIKAGSASEALQCLLKTDVAVVLVDVCMPDINGFELAELIRRHPRCEKTSIILVSGIYLSDFDRLRGYGCGAVDYVPVPVVPELLRAKVSIFADLYRKTEQLSRLNSELERRVAERTAELEASTAHLRESEAKFRRTFECNMIPMGVWTRDGVVVEANDALLTLIGYDRSDLAAGGVRWTEFASPDSQCPDQHFLDEISTKGVGCQYEKEIVAKDGRRIPILFGGASFDQNAARGVFFAVDLTQQRRVEEERSQLLESERQARESAEAANRSKDRFLAVLSHELRTPLTPVLMSVSAMEMNPEISSEVREDLAMIRRNVELETKLIDDLLDLSRITSGKLRLQPQLIDLNDTIRHVCGICQSQLHEKGIRLRTDLDDAIGHLAADPARLQQVLWNILQNAAKFTADNGTIHVSSRLTEDCKVRVHVRDNGIGIDPTVLPRIFDAFEQGHAGITRQFGGLGLGLAISKALVELHKGTIWAESGGPGKGSAFTIELPCESIANELRIRTLPVNDVSLQSQLRLLIVEDHIDTARMLARLLQSSGYSVRTAASVAQALDLAESESFDLIVTDIGLPDATGYELMERIRERSSIKGIAMSGYGMDEDIRKSRLAGFSEHLVKPINVAQLEQAIRRTVSAPV